MTIIGMGPLGTGTWPTGTWLSFAAALVSLLLSGVSVLSQARQVAPNPLVPGAARAFATVAFIIAAMIFLSAAIPVLENPGGYISSAEWLFDTFSPVGFLLLLALNARAVASNRLKHCCGDLKVTTPDDSNRGE